MRNDNIDFVYRNPRPLLTINNKGGASLGNCYSASYYEVTSLHPLSMEDLHRLRESGFLGYGQEFRCVQLLDNGDTRVAVPARFNVGRYVVGYKEGDDKLPKSTDTKPSGTDLVPCQMYDRYTYKHIEGVAINPYSNVPYAPNEQTYYVYACESRVDSSD